MPYEYRHPHRVRYRECDPMGVVYHTHYLDYFEAARTEALRNLGVSYRSLEESGIIMPVTDVSVQYRRPAHYDDELEVAVQFNEMPSVRVFIEYTVRRKDEDTVLVTGHTTLCFMDASRRRPTSPPEAVHAVFAEALSS
ncbi:MAG: acyl-CoA thioesterase [Salinivenus sp.]